ncbi:MAG: 2-hydroxymuconate semialdehyde hydrolase [Bacteroidota bacterium]|jgi:pimeloyl-ACP methyl ester carboxylesterase
MNEKKRLVKLSRFIGKWSLSRILRWVLFLGSVYWVTKNWQTGTTLNELSQKYAYPDSRWIDVDGQAIHYRATGPVKGTPILLLHDEGSSMHTWNQWTDSLSRKQRIISVDLPGFGLTGPNPRGSYSSFMYASFLEHLTDSLKLNKFTLAGVGLGAQIAWFFAAEHPERLEKLILLDAPGYNKEANNVFTILGRTPVLNSVMWTVTPKSIFSLYLEGIYADDRLVTDSLVQRHFDLALRPGNRKAYTDRLSVRDNRPPVDFVERITTPTLILWGAEDAQISPQHAYDFHRRIKGALLKIYQNTGHWPQEENGGETAKDVQAFLDGKF